MEKFVTIMHKKVKKVKHDETYTFQRYNTYIYICKAMQNSGYFYQREYVFSQYEMKERS